MFAVAATAADEQEGDRGPAEEGGVRGDHGR